MHIGKRIQRLMKSAKVSTKEMAGHCGITPSAVSAWFSTGRISKEKLALAAELLKVSTDDLISGDFDAAKGNVSALSIPPAMRQIPVISSVQAGEPSEIIDAYAQGAGSRFVWSDRGGRHTFALEIVGDSMAPEFNEGDTILIDPDVSPTAGRYVVAKCGHADATFKKYRPRGTDEQGRPLFELVPLNGNYGTLQSDRDRCEIIGVMIEHRINY